MPINSDQALSGVLRAAVRSLHDEPVRNASEEYAEFLVHVREEAAAAEAIYRKVRAMRPDSPELAAERQHAYMHALRVTMAALLMLGHFPFMDSIDEALPGERMEG